MRATFLMLAALAALTTSAAAVDLTTPITQFNGQPLTNAQGLPEPITLGKIISDTLLITDGNVTAAEKNKRFWLALKVHGKKDATFSPEELVLIKDVLGKYQTILIAGQAIRVLDPTSIPKD